MNVSSGSAALNGMFAAVASAARRAQAEGVVEELTPGPAPLGDPVLGEDVLVDVVEDAVADVAGVRAALRRADAVGVVGGADPQVGRLDWPHVGVGDVVAAAVETFDGERHGG